MRVLLLSRYGALGASTRMRFLLYRAALEQAGIELAVSSLLGDGYLRALYAGRRAWGSVFAGYCRRLYALLRARQFDLVWLEKEALPWWPVALETGLLPAGVPLLVDYDDAIFHNYDIHSQPWVRRLFGRRIDAVMARAGVVVAGNEYLAARARSAGAKRVEIIPTVVDLDRYSVSLSTGNSVPCVGWIGSPSTQHLLAGIARPLTRAAAALGTRFVAIGANELPFHGDWAATQPWSEATEARAIGGVDIGVMPLPDEPWERGKCGYKLIQYMASGKPVIASPVGVNSYIVRHGENGYLAETEAEWDWALRSLVENPSLREQMGLAGRRRVEEEFCLSVTAPRLIQLFQETARRGLCVDL